jgi:cytochrome c oxidase assembly protein subunit 15
MIACATFLLIVAGALVTSNDAGLSVPDWPTSFGHSPISYRYFTVPMIGGVRYEHGHRILAEFIGLLTIVLAAWTWRADRRSWMKKLGLAALGMVIVQGIFGGVTVLLGLPAVVSTIHAALGQTFFCIVVAIAVLTGREWVGQEPLVRFDRHRLSLPVLAWLSVGIVFVQLILGSMFRHHGMRLLPHLVAAVVVAVVLLWTILRTFSQYREAGQLSRPAATLLILLFTQLVLGFAAYMTRIVWGEQSATSTYAMIAATVAHVAVGALLLATALVLAIQATRHVPALGNRRLSQTEKVFAA